jgi:polyribonucleotide nucleotidyltransferase
MIVQVKMTVDEALEFADEWMQGMSFYEGSQGWRVVCMVLASEVRLLRDAKSAFVDKEQDFTGVGNKLEGLLRQDELQRNELTREVEVEMKLTRLEKLQKIQDEVEEFIAAHDLKNHHYLSDKEIIAEFSMYRKKHVREAINNLR